MLRRVCENRSRGCARQQKLSGPALWTALGDLLLSMAYLSRGLQHSKSLEMLLTSVDTAVKVRSTVNTKRTVYSVAGPHSSQICRCPSDERMNDAFRVSVASSALWTIWLLDTHQNTVKLSLDHGLPACCVEWFPAGADQTKLVWISGVGRLRTGHALAEQFGLDLPQLCLLQKHRFAGHLARSKSGLPGPQNAHDSRSGVVAPCAGRTRQIEMTNGLAKCSQSTSAMSLAMAERTSGILLWPRRTESKVELLKAQDRTAWKRDEWVCARAQ